MMTLDQLAEQAADLLRRHGYGNLGRSLLVAIQAQREPFRCKARSGGDPVEPQDCDWPLCGCDPAADKVLAALQEAGYLSPKEAEAQREQLEQAQKQRNRLCEQAATDLVELGKMQQQAWMATTRAEKAEQQLTQVTQEREAEKARADMLRGEMCRLLSATGARGMQVVVEIAKAAIESDSETLDAMASTGSTK